MCTKRFLSILVCCAAIGLTVVLPRNATAQGQWFDIGDGTVTTIRSQSDVQSTIYFPSYPFGNFYPPGTLVYAELESFPASTFAVAYWAYFDDGGCGCNGQPSEPITYSIHYSEDDLPWPEELTKLYTKVQGEWVEVTNAVQDTDNNTWTTVRNVVNTNLYLAIGVPESVPARNSTWGRVKVLYDGN